MAGKGGGAWKVAYADFVTAMMAFFLVMWITSQNQGVREAIAQHFQDPFAPVGFADEKAQGTPRHNDQTPAHRAAPPTENEKRRKLRRPTFLLTGHGTTTSVGVVIFFDESSTELDQEARQELDDLLPWLKGKPQKIEIRGHASRRPLPEGSPLKDAWQLSYARCVATMAYLQDGGVMPERLRLSQSGPFETIVEDGKPAGLDRRERVEVRLLDEVVRIVEPAKKSIQPATKVHEQHTSEAVAHAEGDHGHAEAPAAAAHAK